MLIWAQHNMLSPHSKTCRNLNFASFSCFGGKLNFAVLIEKLDFVVLAEKLDFTVLKGKFNFPVLAEIFILQFRRKNLIFRENSILMINKLEEEIILHLSFKKKKNTKVFLILCLGTEDKNELNKLFSIKLINSGTSLN